MSSALPSPFAPDLSPSPSRVRWSRHTVNPEANVQLDERWHTAKVGSRTLEYLTSSPTESVTNAADINAAGTILFFHGWGLSPRSYIPVLTALNATTEHPHQILAPTLPGFGNSHPLPARQQNVAGIAAHIARFLEQHHPHQTGPLHVMGHSLGGGVAVKLAALRPDLITTLTLASPVGGAGQGAVPIRHLLGGILSDTRHGWILRATRDVTTAVRRNPIAVTLAAYAAWQSDQLNDLAVIDHHNIPTQFIFANKDTVVTPGNIPHLSYKNVKTEVIDGRHSWLLTEPSLFANKAAHLLNSMTAAPEPRTIAS